jgi:hypothetical protein
MTRVIVLALLGMGWLMLATFLVLLWPLRCTAGYWGYVLTVLMLTAVIYDQWVGAARRRWGYFVPLFGSIGLAALGYWLAR